MIIRIGGKKRKPRRILHFSDGVLEEYSTEEEQEVYKIFLVICMY